MVFVNPPLISTIARAKALPFSIDTFCGALKRPAVELFGHSVILFHLPTPPSLGAIIVVPLSAVTEDAFHINAPIDEASVPTAAN